jgi:hypothetical protein
LADFPTAFRLLESGRVVAGEKAIVQALKADALAQQLLLDPLVAVQAQLDRVGQVGADFEERRAPVAVLDVVIQMVDIDRLAGELKADGSRGGGTLRALERGAPLLGHPDEDHPLLARLPPPHLRGDPILALEAHPGNALLLDELLHLTA